MKDEEKTKEQLIQELEELRFRNLNLEKIEADFRHLEKVLQENDQIYRASFDQSPAVKLLIDPKTGDIVDANLAAAKFYGYSLPQLKSMKITDINMLPVDQVQTEMTNAYTKRRDKFTFRHRISTGEIRDVEVYSGPIQIGDRLLLHSIIHDVTERLQAENNLKRNEERLKFFVENAPVAVAMFDRDMHYMVGSKRYLKDHRISLPEVIGKSHYDVFPLIPERWKEIHRRCLAGAIEKCEEDPFPREDGTLDWVRWEIQPWRNYLNEIGGIILFSEVITERRQVEEALRKSERRLLGVLESMPDAFVSFDHDMHYTYVNANAERLQAAQREELLGKDVRVVYPDAESQKTIRQYERVIREQEPVTSTSYHAGFDRWVEVRAFPTPDGVSVFYKDVSDNVKADKALRESEARFRLALKNAPVSVAAQGQDLRYIWAYNQRTASPAAIIGKNDYEIFTPEEAARLEIIKRRVLEENIEIREQMWFNRPTGPIFLDVCWEPIHDETGEVIGVASATVDLTPIKAVEEALRQAQNRMQADLDAMKILQKLNALYVGKENLNSILLEIVDAAIAISRADFGNIQLLDPETSDLRIAAQRGFPQWWLDFWNTLAKGQGACGRALESKDRVIVEDVEENPIFIGTPALEIQRRAGVRAVQSTPLVSRSGRPLGMFSTHYKVPHSFDDRIIGLLDLLASQAVDIIDGLQAEEALVKAHEQALHLARFPEENPNPVVRVGMDGIVLYCNPSSAVTPGWECLVGHPINQHLQPLVWRAIEKNKQNQENVEIGGRFYAVLAVPFPVELYVNIYGQDITERKRAEDALRESEERLRVALGATNTAMWDWEVQTGKVVWSPEHFLILGYEPGSVEPSYANFTAKVHPDDLPKTEAVIRETMSQRREYRHDFRVILAEGGVRWIEARAHYFYDTKGACERMLGVMIDITERKKIAETLERERELLQTIMDSAGKAHLVYLDRDFNFVRVNETYAASCGFRPEEMIGQNHFDLYPHAENEAIFTHVRDTGEPVEFHDKPFVFPDQPERGVTYWDWTLIPVKDTTGQVDGLIFSLFETTSRKQAEESLRQNQATLQSILNATQESIWLFSPDGTILLGNQTAFQRMAKPPEAIIGKHFNEIVPDDVAELRLTQLRKTIESGQPLEFEDERSGIKFHHSFYPVFDQDGRVQAVTSFSRDITEQRRAEEITQELLAAVQMERDRLSALINSIPDEVWFADINKQFTLANRSALQEFRIGTFEEAIDVEKIAAGLEVYRPDGSLRPIDEAPPLRALQGEVVKNQEEIIRTPSRGELRFRQVSASPVRDAMGNIIGSVSVVHDITERKRMVEELQRAHDELEIRVQERTAELCETVARLEQLNRELEEFTFVASHDLQEPLRKIETFGGIVKKNCAALLDQTNRDHLDRVLRSTSRMRQLLRDLLKLSRVATKKEPFKKIDLSQIAKEAADVFEVSIKETGGRIEINEMPFIEADASQMGQLFQNLIGNALKFQDNKNPLIQVLGKVDKGLCEVMVRDNGIGFSPEFSEVIFKPFERLHGPGEYEGTGMGLAICRKIVERHGGTISAESEPGKGSTFTIKLPLKQVRREEV